MKKNKSLKIPIIAKIPDNIVEGHAILIMTLPTIKGPEFTENAYVAEYPENGKGQIKFNPELKFKTDVEVTSITLTGKCVI